MTKKINLSIFLFFILISHVLLPVLNEGEDFLLFTTWRLFDGPPNKIVIDISWDQGENFLFRDYREKLKVKNIDTVSMFYRIKLKKDQVFKEGELEKLLEICQCQKLELYELKGSNYDHFILQRKLETLSRSIIN